MKSSVLLVCIATQIFFVSCKVIPDYLPQPCSKSDPDYNGCATKNFNTLGPYLLKGIPELNIPSLNPLQVPLFEASKNIDDCANFSIVLRNAEVSGLNTTSLKIFRYNLDTMRGEVELHIESIKVKAEYDIGGRISQHSVMDSGLWEANATGIDVFYNYSVKVVEREGVNYYTLDDFDRHFKVSGAHLNLTSNNPQQQFKVNMLTKFVNEDIDRALLLSSLLSKPGTLQFYRDRIERVFSAVPADELTPP